MNKFTSLLIALAFVMGFAGSAQAQRFILNDPPEDEVLCELDWNRDGVVDQRDYFEVHENGTYRGFYWDVYRDVHFASDASLKRSNLNLDWNGDGVVTMDDAGGPNLYIEGSFYTQLQTFIDWWWYPQVYEQLYPNSACSDACIDSDSCGDGTQSDDEGVDEPDNGSTECCDDSGGCFKKSGCEGCGGLWEYQDGTYTCRTKDIQGN